MMSSTTITGLPEMEPDEVGFPLGDLPVMGAAVVTVADLRTLVEHMNSKLLVQANALRALQEEALRAKETEAMSVLALQELKAVTAHTSHEIGYLKQERIDVLDRELVLANDEASRQKHALEVLEASLDEFRNEVKGPLVQEVLSSLDAAMESLRIDLRKTAEMSQDWEQKLRTTNGDVGSLAEDLRTAKVMNSVESEALRGLVSNLEEKERLLRQRTDLLEADGASREKERLRLKEDVSQTCATSEALSKSLDEATTEMHKNFSAWDARQRAAEFQADHCNARMDAQEGELGKAQEILASLRLFVDNDLKRHVTFAGQRFEELAQELQKLQSRLSRGLDQLPVVQTELQQLQRDQQRDKQDVEYLLSHKEDFERVPEMREDVDEALARTAELRTRAQGHQEILEKLSTYQTELQRHVRYDAGGNVSLRCGNATLTLSMPEGDPENTMTQQLIEQRDRLTSLEQEKQGLLDKVEMLREKALNM